MSGHRTYEEKARGRAFRSQRDHRRKHPCQSLVSFLQPPESYTIAYLSNLIHPVSGASCWWPYKIYRVQAPLPPTHINPEPSLADGHPVRNAWLPACLWSQVLWQRLCSPGPSTAAARLTGAVFCQQEPST